MKWRILLLLCITSFFATAQLSISNTNYIYVVTDEVITDTYIYIEDDLNLKDAGSYIYLRKDAQILQGAGTTGNSGVGQLSMYQTGTTHNYAYNYWCSPVGNNNTDDFNNRGFIPNDSFYDVTSEPITSSLATYTSSHDGTSAPLVVSSYWLWSYDPGTVYSEWDHVGDTGSVTTGYGFTMKGTSGSSNAQLYDFRGKPNNGTITTSVLNGEWTLIGNPYPSALDAVDFIHDTQNQTSINGSLYYWEQDLTVSSHYVADYVGGYASYTITSDGVTETFTPATFDTYNSDGSFNTTGSSSSSGKAAKRYIPVGQGFMVEGIANSTVRTMNSHRNYYKQTETQSEFFDSVDLSIDKNNNLEDPENSDYKIQYNENGLQKLPSDYKRFRLNIDFDDTYTRQILQNFHSSATEGFDYGLEIKSPEGVDSDAHWIMDGKPYVAQAFNFNKELIIPLVINVNSQQVIRFRIFDVQNFDENLPIYLHDIINDTYADLRIQDYQVTLEASTHTDRFEITFMNHDALDNPEFTINDLTVFQDNSKSRLTILNPKGLPIKGVSLFDANGKKIIDSGALETRAEYYFPTKNLSDGIYATQISFVNQNSFSKKLIVKN